jgi:hypothetical protein
LGRFFWCFFVFLGVFSLYAPGFNAQMNHKDNQGVPDQ